MIEYRVHFKQETLELINSVCCTVRLGTNTEDIEIMALDFNLDFPE